MSLSVATLARRLPARCIEYGVPATARADGVASLADFVMTGDARFATVVTGEPEEVVDRLAAGDDRAAALRRAIFATASVDSALHAALEEHRMTALVVEGMADETLHARLDAMFALDQASADRLVVRGMRLLTQVGRRGGVAAVVTELAALIDGWAVLLDPHGQLIASAGAGRLHIDDAVAVALGRPVRVRHASAQSHQVGSDRDLVGYLVVTSRSEAFSLGRDLAQQAAALCDLLLRSHNPSLTSSLGREALLGTILAGGADASSLLRRWGVHEASMSGFALGARSRTIDLERLSVRWLDELGAEHVFSGTSRIEGFVRDELVAELAQRVEASVPLEAARVHLGIGSSAPVEALQRTALQARQALETALENDRPVVRYAELPAVELVVDGLTREASAELASMLDPLRDPDGTHGVLTETLRVFLAEHGGHRASARRLGIHRQTLVARIRRVEERLGLSMARADDRAAAWIALRAAGR